VYRMKTDGSDIYSFGYSESLVSMYAVEDGWVYLTATDPSTNKSESIRVKADGTKEQIFGLTDSSETNPQIKGVYDGWIYFKSGKVDEALVRMKPNGSEREVVLGKSDIVNHLIFLQDKLITQTYKSGANYPTTYISNLDGSGFILLQK
jgi:hypothetical protein